MNLQKPSSSIFMEPNGKQPLSKKDEKKYESVDKLNTIGSDILCK